MIFGSVCSGIEAATVAWHPLDWRPAFFSEIDAFPCALLKHYYPAVPNHGDMTKFKDWPDATLDVLVGGTPCQAFSVAGLRKGLDDPRGNLTLVYLAIAAKYRPEWLVWENVPGAGALASEPGMKQQTYLMQSVNCPRERKQNGIGISDSETMYSLTGRDLHGIANTMQVRRLTPLECERLQGFPDDYTLVPYRNKPAADGPRYKVLGNSMAVPVMRWIGERIQAVEEFHIKGAA